MQSKILNLGIVAHADAGKTSLTEQILFKTGAIRALGSVDEGTAVTDAMEIERQRGISVRSASASVLWKSCRLNLIDAPGHADFLSEVERGLAALDAAVLVISAVEGVQAQTRLLIEAISAAHLPCFIFINKLDRVGSDTKRVLSEVERCGVPCLCMSKVWSEGSSQVCSNLIEHSSPDFIETAVLAMEDEALFEQFLLGENMDIQNGTLIISLSKKVSSGSIYPVVCGATKYGLGVEDLLDTVCLLLNEPKALTDQEGIQHACARVYKVEHDDTLGKAAYVRVFSAEIGSRQSIRITKPGKPHTYEEKISRVRLTDGRRLTDSETIPCGCIGAVYGLSQVQAGDLLGAPLSGLREYRLSEPMLLSRIEPLDPSELPVLSKALKELQDEDPALGFQWNREKGELWAQITGKLQVEVLGALILERFGIKVKFSEPSVIYRETPISTAEGFESYTWPKPCWAVVKFLIEPLPRGSGFQYECKVSSKQLMYRYQTHVETAVPRALTQGLMGWQVTDLKVTLIDGGSHHVHTHPLDFFVATPMGIMDGLRNCGTKLLEPVLKVDMSGPKDTLGRVMGLLSNRRAVFQPADISDQLFRLSAMVPAAEAMELPVDFAAATGGMGIYASRFSHYQDCPPGMGACRNRIGPDPLDRSRFILAARSALEEGE